MSKVNPLIVPCLAMMLAMLSCATSPETTTEDRLAMQTHVFAGETVESVLKACRSVMKKEGYHGMRLSKGAKWMGGTLGENARGENGPEEPQDLFVNVETTSRGVEVRASFQDRRKRSLASEQAQEILDPWVYREFFQKLGMELGSISPIGARAHR